MIGSRLKMNRLDPADRHPIGPGCQRLCQFRIDGQIGVKRLDRSRLGRRREHTAAGTVLKIVGTGTGRLGGQSLAASVQGRCERPQHRFFTIKRGPLPDGVCRYERASGMTARGFFRLGFCGP